MSAAHTRGPWEASDRGDYGDFDGDSRVILGDDIRIAAVHDTGNEEAEANARLIEAAPDMLEALELRKQSDETAKAAIRNAGNARARLQRKADSEAHRARELARAAIAKAKGEQQ